MVQFYTVNKQVKLFLMFFILTISQSFAQPGCPMASCTFPRYIRVNVHFVLKDDHTGNFRETDDGNGNTSYNGYKYAQDFINSGNIYLMNNEPMTLPLGNSTPVCSTNFRYELKGVYFHDDSYNYVLNFPTYNNQLEQYMVNESSEINVFFCKSSINQLAAVSLENKNNIIMAGYWELYVAGTHLWGATLLNHEIGHLQGLGHTWSTDDNCSDTPFNSNSGCTETNNVMDYGCQTSYTPCQIEKIITRLNSSDFKRYIAGPTMHLPNNCTGESVWLYGNQRPQKHENIYALEIFETDFVGSSNILSGYWTQNFTGQFEDINLSSLYSFTPGTEGGKLYRIKISYGSAGCGYFYEDVWHVFYLNPTSTILLQNTTITSNKNYQTVNFIETGRDVNASLPQGNFEVPTSKKVFFTAQQYIALKPGTKLMSGSSCKASIISELNCDPGRPVFREENHTFNKINKNIASDELLSFDMYPNPVNDFISITTSEEGNISFQVLNTFGEEVLSAQRDIKPAQPFDINLSNLKAGSYILVMQSGKKRQIKKLIKY